MSRISGECNDDTQTQIPLAYVISQIQIPPDDRDSQASYEAKDSADRIVPLRSMIALRFAVIAISQEAPMRLVISHTMQETAKPAYTHVATIIMNRHTRPGRADFGR